MMTSYFHFMRRLLTIFISFLVTLSAYAQGKILFIGTIYGDTEISFLHSHLATITLKHYGPKDIILSTYKKASAQLTEQATKNGFTLLENVDGTKLHLNQQTKDQVFDHIIWIGPTNDDNITKTPDLVKAFILSSRALLSENGSVVVVQSVANGHFRKILSLNDVPLLYLGRILTDQRLQTKGSSLGKRLEDLFISPKGDLAKLDLGVAKRTDYVSRINAISCQYEKTKSPADLLIKNKQLNAFLNSISQLELFFQRYPQT